MFEDDLPTQSEFGRYVDEHVGCIYIDINVRTYHTSGGNCDTHHIKHRLPYRSFGDTGCIHGEVACVVLLVQANQG